MKLLLALAPLFLISCVPNYLVPYDYSIAQNNIEAYIELDSITIAVKSLKVKSDYYVFGVDIQNHSPFPVFIDHQKMRKHASNLSYRDSTISILYQETNAVMSPTQINRMFKTKANEAQAAGFALFLLGAAISAYTEIEDEKDAKKEKWTEKDEKKALTRELVSAVSLATVDVLSEVANTSKERALTELRYLPDELFDREIIYPNESYYGKVFFRKPGIVHKYQRVVIPMEGDSFQFDFRKATGEEKRHLYRRDRAF